MSEISEFKVVIQNNKEINKMKDTKVEIDYLLFLINKAEQYEKALQEICELDDHDVSSGYWMKEIALKVLEI